MVNVKGKDREDESKSRQQDLITMSSLESKSSKSMGKN